MNGTVLDADNATDILLPMCKGFSRMCSLQAYEYLAEIINVLSIFINILHMLVLNRMPSDKNLTRILTMYSMISLVDIFCAAVYFIKANCYMHHLVAHTSRWIAITIVIAEDAIIMYRYSLLMIICAERYISICHPTSADTFWCMRHVKTTSFIILLLVLGLFAARDVLSIDGLCLHPVIGVMTMSKLATVIFFLSVLIPLMIADILILKVLWEIHQMKKRQLTPFDHCKGLKRSFQYVVIITVGFHVCFVPVVASLLVKLVAKLSTEYTAIVVTLVNSIYGIFNTLLYGWMFKRYRRFLVQMFKLGKCLENKNQTVAA